jgi:hypothetical protein
MVTLVDSEVYILNGTSDQFLVSVPVTWIYDGKASDKYTIFRFIPSINGKTKKPTGYKIIHVESGAQPISQWN